MKFAKRVFMLAGIYGLIVLAPQYLLESRTSQDYPPAITHPEYYYGFLGVALAFQVVFLIIARDPVRYRAMMIPSMLEKATFGAAALVLFLLNRIPTIILVFAGVDMFLCALFLIAYAKTGEARSAV